MTQTLTDILNSTTSTYQDRHDVVEQRLQEILNISPIEARWKKLEELGKEIASLIVEYGEDDAKLVLIPDFLAHHPQSQMLCYMTSDALNDLSQDSKKHKNQLLNSSFSKSSSGQQIAVDFFFAGNTRRSERQSKRLQYLKESTLSTEERIDAARRHAQSDDQGLIDVKMLGDADFIQDYQRIEEDTTSQILLLVSITHESELEGLISYISEVIQFRGERQREYMLSDAYRRANEGRRVKPEEFEHLILEKMLNCSSYASASRLIGFIKTLQESNLYEKQAWEKVEETLQKATNNPKIASDQREVWEAVATVLAKSRLEESLKDSPAVQAKASKPKL